MTKEKTKAVKVIEPKQEVTSIETFISQAIQANVPIETMERLLAMRDKVKQEQSKEAFVRAMAQFQSKCPIIEKKKIVNDKFGKKRYSYAPLESIVEQVKGLLADNGLSYDFDEIKDEKYVSAVCTVTHILGYSKVSTFKVEIGKEDYMTDTQKYGARMTFAKRYAFCNAFGILTGDEDTDAKGDDNVLSDDLKNSIEKITTLEGLKTFYLANKGKGKDFDKAVTEHKKLLEQVQKDENTQ
jgi:hypothetical protein